MIDAMLFELEGVVAQTLPLRARALEDALAAEGIILTGGQAAELSRGRSVRRAVAAAALAGKVSFDLVMVDVVASAAERAFAALLASGGVALAPGAAAFVQHVHGVTRCALVTRASRSEAEHVLRLAGLDDAFECLVTLDDVADEKPSPVPYRTAIGRMGRRRPVATRSIVALEDGADGARAARAAGIMCIVAGPAPASDALEADAYLPSLESTTMESIRAIAARAGAHAP